MALLKANKGRVRYVYVTETRPFQQGLMTAKDLVSSHEKVRFIVDSACGFFMLHTDFVLVGADALRREGVVNKIGTLPLAVMAKAFHKPVYVVADTFKIDHREHLHIEERPAKEIYGSVRGEQALSSLRSVKIYNPVFDVTPWKYVDAVITEKGVFKPDKIKRMIRKSGV
jgi:ribose 1,5-bisphosphate isomerase